MVNPRDGEEILDQVAEEMGIQAPSCYDALTAAEWAIKLATVGDQEEETLEGDMPSDSVDPEHNNGNNSGHQWDR